MRAHAKERLTEVRVIIGEEKSKIFLVPNDNIKNVRTQVREILSAAQENGEIIPAEKMFPSLIDSSIRPGVALRIARLKSGLSQLRLAEKIVCEQSDISKMESGKISIGKARAKKLGLVLRINYRVFL